MKLKKWLIGAAVIVAVVAAGGYLYLSSLQMFATAPVYQTGDGALNGYDPVAYFTQNQPVRGREDIIAEWNGAVWRFATAENRAAFQLDPERFAPQFGGYCAYAVANGYTAKTDPNAWQIIDDRLYLNFDASTAEKWSANSAAFIKEANANWPRVIQD